MKRIITGGFIGFVCFNAGYFVAQWHMKNYYAALAEGEIQDARKEYKDNLEEVRKAARKKLDDLENERHMSLLQEAIATEEERLQVEADRATKKDVPTQPMAPHDYTQYHDKVIAGGDVQTKPSTVLATVDPGMPMIITEEQYLNAQEAAVLYLYADDVMCDEDMAPMTKDQRAEVLGYLEPSIGEYMNDERNSFVWNPALQRAYQIVIENDSYGEGVEPQA